MSKYRFDEVKAVLCLWASLASLEQHDIFYVWRMREHVDGLYGLYTIVGIEQLQVACLRGRVARDVDDA